MELVVSTSPAEEQAATPSSSHRKVHSSHSLEFQDITFSVTNTKLGALLTGGQVGTHQILHGISGRVISGMAMAIMGPSGAGKTTLLETLARQPSVVNNENIALGGSVTIDGEQLTRSYFAKHCAFVPQYDALWPAMTAVENLEYAARLYGDFGGDVENMNAAISDIMEELGLSSCKDVKVGNVFLKGLSGGQKRRLSLGCELVSGRKEILFLDEPTSGLDAASASEIMKLIRRIAKIFNLIVCCSIHQPSSHVFFAFDRLLLLSGGHSAFFGQAADSLAYFETIGHKMSRTMNPADFLLEVVNSDFTDKAGVQAVIDAWKHHAKDYAEAPAKSFVDEEQGGAIEVKPVPGPTGDSVVSQGSSPMGRTMLLMSRAFKCYSRDPALYLLRFAMYGFMSVFLGVTYIDVSRDNQDVSDRLFCIMWMIAFFSYMGMVALPAFSLEKTIIVKEITNGSYTLGEYVLAIALIQIPLIVLCATIASIGPYWFPVLNPLFTRWLVYVVIFSAHLYVVESLAILVAGLIPNFVLGLIVFCSALSQMFVFNGFFISVGNMPVYLIWIYYTSPFAYTTQALFKVAFSGLDMLGYQKCLNRAEYPCYGRTGAQVLDSISDADLEYNDVNPWHWFLVLIAFAVALRFQFYLAVRKAVY
eukprot:CAMPEP_0118974766 /NCGR_PEP_ID=MMETSP1173-20130426/13343_1 /TAXON_ID=1034831 /ORGANISM="Rhizochromulina marina cf, Strain CCMP1243" /LENGTH=645 /DNA_ID=CAMNT_0006924557 /DNA_START=63 /DNA_END=2000 /DNA_ORIENTATION=+